MASKRVRGMVPQRPIVRIVLLLAVVGMASGVAGTVFTRGETAARDPAPQPAGAGAPAAAPDTPDPAEITAPPEPGDESAADTNTPAGTGEPTTPLPDDGSATAEPTDAGAPAAAPDTPDPAEITAPPEPGDGSAGGPAQLIERLRPLVTEPDPNAPEYDRDHFAGWLDSDGDCVNTRHEILQAEAVEYSMNAEGCAVAAGEWFDPYTNRTFSNPRDLDVDHVVALADAWVSGAWRWADEVLDRFSNDPGNLNAIAAGENRSKSARGPATYRPTAAAGRCGYLVQYATVKIRWDLSVTPQDFDALAAGLRSCDVGALGDTSPAATATRPSAPPPPATTVAPATTTAPAAGCHPAYEPCLPHLPGDAVNCGDLRPDQKPVTVIVIGEDPYRLDRDRNGTGCTS